MSQKHILYSFSKRTQVMMAVLALVGFVFLFKANFQKQDSTVQKSNGYAFEDNSDWDDVDIDLFFTSPNEVRIEAISSSRTVHFLGETMGRKAEVVAVLPLYILYRQVKIFH